MNRGYALLAAAAMAACSGREEIFHVAPDQKHVLIGSETMLRSIDVDTLAEVGRVTDVNPNSPFFSRDGSMFVARSTRKSFMVAAAAGGAQVDLGPTADPGIVSIDGTRVAFLRNPDVCSASTGFCAELFSAASGGGEAVRVASGIPVQPFYDAALSEAGYAPDPYFFAGNDRLLFRNADLALMSVPTDGSAAPVSLASAYVRTPGELRVPPSFWVLRDGRVVVNDGTGLLLMDAQGGARVRIGEANSSPFCDLRDYRTVDFSCPLSAAGALAVITPATASTSTVRLVSLSGGASVTVTASGKWMEFDSDGRFVFFDPDRFLSQALPSGEVRRLRPTGLDDLPGAVSPDGKWAAFVSQGSIGFATDVYTVQLLSTVTGLSWFPNITTARQWEFSPDSSLLLLLTYFRQLFVVPVEIGEPRLIETDVDQAQWAGPRQIVIRRSLGSPKGVFFLPVR